MSDSVREARECVAGWRANYPLLDEDPPIGTLVRHVEALLARVDAAEKQIDENWARLILERDAGRLAVARVEKLTYASDDGVEWEHNHDGGGEPTCPACWAASIRRAIGGDV